MADEKRHIELLEPIKAQGRQLPAGAKVPYDWIPEDQLPQLIEDGIIQIIKTVLPKKKIKMVERIVSTTPDLPNIGDMTVISAQTWASGEEDLEMLYRVRAIEEKEKKRKTVLTTIDRKIRELEGIGK